METMWSKAFHGPETMKKQGHLETFGQIPCAVPQGGFALGRPARSWGTITLSPASRTLPRGRAMSGFPRVQKHPLLRGGIKGGGRLKRVNFAPHGTLVHRRRSSQRPKMPIICQIEVRNPSYGGGLLPPHRMHGRDKRSPVIAN